MSLKCNIRYSYCTISCSRIIRSKCDIVICCSYKYSRLRLSISSSDVCDRNCISTLLQLARKDRNRNCNKDAQSN
nr:MAG TPA: hypothetical protein [Caudoviricetes sp.]